jgi:L-fuconate dehydratase
MTELIAAVDAVDVRFPTSWEPDRSATYVTVRTNGGLEGFGLTFTVGRGNEITVAAVRSLAPLVVGLPVDAVFAGVLSDRPRWLGPAKAVLVDAVWDLRARSAGKPVWRLLADLSPDELVSLVDFRYIADALTPDEALDILRAAAPGRAERRKKLLAVGYPATPGWFGHSDDELVRLAMAAVDYGHTQIKLAVGTNQATDERRMGLARTVVGSDLRIALHANQAWGVGEAIERLRPLAPYDPYWVEEPTSSGDVLGHAVIRKAVAPVKVVSGEHNVVVVKQLLQAGAVDVLRTGAGGMAENVAILLLAAKFGVPVCPHVGMCETVAHLAMFDYVAVSGTTEDRMIEYVDHPREHFVDPVRVRGGHYLAPTEPGLGARMRPESVARFRFPDGAEWAAGG